MTEDQGSIVVGQEGVVSIKRDLDRGVAVISMRGGNTHFSLEVEGGKDGKSTLSEIIISTRFLLSALVSQHYQRIIS